MSILCHIPQSAARFLPSPISIMKFTIMIAVNRWWWWWWWWRWWWWWWWWWCSCLWIPNECLKGGSGGVAVAVYGIARGGDATTRPERADSPSPGRPGRARLRCRRTRRTRRWRHRQGQPHHPHSTTPILHSPSILLPFSFHSPSILLPFSCHSLSILLLLTILALILKDAFTTPTHYICISFAFHSTQFHSIEYQSGCHNPGNMKPCI